MKTAKHKFTGLSRLLPDDLAYIDGAEATLSISRNLRSGALDIVQLDVHDLARIADESTRLLRQALKQDS